jgi:hypothetical protein
VLMLALHRISTYVTITVGIHPSLSSHVPVGVSRLGTKDIIVAGRANRPRKPFQTGSTGSGGAIVSNYARPPKAHTRHP